MRSIVRARRISDSKMISIQCYFGVEGVTTAHKHAKELQTSGRYYLVTVTEIPDIEDDKPYYQKETRYIAK